MMAIRQLYYTSCRHPRTGRTGFQIKAASPGIAPAALDALQRLLVYWLPPALLGTPLPEHPVALRYAPLSGGEAALVCIHSSGLDEFDRPGNYFAHAVIGPADQIARVYPPVTYWDSPFWVQRDDTARTELPISDDFAAEVAFDYDAVWAFLDAGPRRAWFRALLEAVVDSAQSRRRVVIVDSAHHVALWVYAVSLALPSRFRPMLSFATYYHDPLAAAFVIAGTSPEGISARPGGPPRFVLDATAGAVDDAPASAFAAYICDHFTPDGYESEILEFLDWAEARDDCAVGINHLLDDLTVFYLAAHRGVSGAGAASLARAARYVLDDAARTGGAYPQDADDLRAAAAVYADLLAESGAAEHLDGYQRALTALAQLGADMTDTAPTALRLYVGCILDNQLALAASLGRAIEALYPPDVVAAALDQAQLPAHQLIDAAFRCAVADQLDAPAVELVSRLAANPRQPLSAAQRAAVEGVLALRSGRFPSGAALAALRDRLAALEDVAYRAETGLLLRRFFAAETHPDLVRALYARARRDDFWALYWERFSAALLDEGRAEETAAVLDAWFTRSAALASGAPYALPEFFLQLPAALETLRADRRYAQVSRAFEAQLAAYDWHPLVRQTAQGRAARRPLSGLFDR
ncbi:MAG: GAP1-N2 domain-containing protein [Aggregatilineales bacterium]